MIAFIAGISSDDQDDLPAWRVVLVPLEQLGESSAPELFVKLGQLPREGGRPITKDIERIDKRRTNPMRRLV